MMFPRSRDPAFMTQVGWYLTDERTLLLILEADPSGVIGEDCAHPDHLVELAAGELCAWRHVIPAV
jgi:hypothetical protein